MTDLNRLPPEDRATYLEDQYAALLARAAQAETDRDEYWALVTKNVIRLWESGVISMRPQQFMRELEVK